jgi:hypothetical protein
VLFPPGKAGAVMRALYMGAGINKYCRAVSCPAIKS